MKNSYTFRKMLTSFRKNAPRTSKGKLRIVKMSSALHLIFFPLTILYFEILLRILNGTGLFSHLIYPVLFGLAAGFLCTILTSFFKRKYNRLISIILLSLLTLLYIVECMIRSTFQVYMTIGSIFSGAGDVVGGFGSTLVSVIIHGFLTIVFYLIPLIIYLRFGKKKIPAWQYKITLAVPVLAVSLLLFFFGAVLAGHGSVKEIYTTQYSFSNAIENFGLLTGMRLEMKYGNTTKDFVIEEEETLAEEDAQAQEKEQEEEAEKAKHTGYNEMNIDFASLPTDDDTISSMNKYVASLSASNKNDYTGLFEGKNLILICAEAYSDTIVSEKLTPTLYRLIHNGFYFSDYYQPAWGGSTITGEMAYLIGLVPLNYVETIYQTIGENMYFTMGNQLQRLGYYSAAFHNGEYDYYDRQTTHYNLGYETWLGQGNGLEEICGEYVEDGDMFDYTFDTYVDKQPFSIYYMTLSGHCTYDENDSRVKANLQTVIDAVGEGTYEDKTLYYLCYQYELEKGLTRLIDDLEEAGIADDTVVCLTGDHYPYGLENSSTWGNDQDYVSDLYGYDINYSWERDHNSLIIWSGCLENGDKDKWCEISDPTSSLDVVPTLSNLFNLQFDSRLLVGRDVFSDADPLVLWNDYSWITSKGKYDSDSGKFFPNEGESSDESYIEKINNVVSNKLSYSGRVLDVDYYGYLFGSDPETGDGSKTGVVDLSALTTLTPSPTAAAENEAQDAAAAASGDDSSASAENDESGGESEEAS